MVTLLDGHPCLRYADLYPHWRRLERRVFADARAWRTESLWLNPAAARGLKQSSLWKPRA